MALAAAWHPGPGTVALAAPPRLPRRACLPACLPACIVDLGLPPPAPLYVAFQVHSSATERFLEDLMAFSGSAPSFLELTSPLIKTKLHCTASPDNPGCICDAINYVLETVSRFEVLFMNLHISGHHSNMQLKI